MRNRISIRESKLRAYVRKILNEVDPRFKKAEDTLNRFGFEDSRGKKGVTPADRTAAVRGMADLQDMGDVASSMGGRGDMGMLNSALSGEQFDKIETFHKYGKNGVKKASNDQALKALGALFSTDNIEEEDYNYLSFCLKNVDSLNFDPEQKSDLSQELRRTVWTYCDVAMESLEG